MSDAQVGLLVATPIIIGFAIALERMGALRPAGAAAAAIFSLMIAGVLLLTQ